MRAIVVDVPCLNALEEITVRGELARARDALRREGPGRAWLVAEEEGMTLQGSGPLLTISGKCLPEGDDREGAASLLDGILAQRWHLRDLDDAIPEAIAALQSRIADALRALGHGTDARMSIVLPHPTTDGHAIVGDAPNARANAVVAHLARACPLHFIIEREITYGRMRIHPMGARIHLPRPVENPVEAVRTLSTLPKDLLK